MTDPRAIECDQFLPYDPAAVWKAITDPDLLARWWADGRDLRAEKGYRFSLDMGAWGTQACEVVEVQPERMLSFTFAEGVLDTLITWTLIPEGTGTRLFLKHDGFDLDTPLGRRAREGMGAGWPVVLGRIAPVLAGTAA